MCLVWRAWVSVTAKLLHPTAAGNASLSPLVRRSRRRSLLPSCSNTRAGETPLMWELWGSLSLIFGQPCCVTNKAGVCPVYCRGPCSRAGILQVGFRSSPTPSPRSTMGVLQWEVWETQPQGTRVGQGTQPAQGQQGPWAEDGCTTPNPTATLSASREKMSPKNSTS